LPGDAEAGALEQARDPLTEEDIIIGEDHPRLRHMTMIARLARGSR
jgi:hypothetical protein